MAVKIYSDVTKKFYEDEATAVKAEQELEAKRTEAAEVRKQMAQDVEEKRKALKKAQKEYDEVLSKFCEKYGVYHVTIGRDDWESLWNKFWNW